MAPAPFHDGAFYGINKGMAPANGSKTRSTSVSQPKLGIWDNHMMFEKKRTCSYKIFVTDIVFPEVHDRTQVTREVHADSKKLRCMLISSFSQNTLRT